MSGLAIDDLPVAALLVDETAVITATNPAAKALVGGAVGTKLGDALEHPDDLGELAGDDGGATVVARLTGAPPRWVELRSSRVGAEVLVLARDATDEVRTRRILTEAVWSAFVADGDGVRTWGPVGRAHPPGAPGMTEHVADRLHPDDAAVAVERWQRVWSTDGAHDRLTLRGRLPYEDEAWGELTTLLFNLRHVPEVDGLLAVVIDHALKERVDDIARTDGGFGSIAEAAPVGIVVTSDTGVPVTFNEAASRLLPGVGREASRDWTSAVRDDERAEVADWFADVISRQRETSRTVPTVGPAGRWLLVTVAPRFGGEGGVVGFVVTFQDVSSEVALRHELEAAQQRLVHLATHDPLTGLANRTMLTEVVADLEATDRRRPLGVAFCDLDDFKEVNDRLGHEAGDEVLRQVAGRLRKVGRGADVVARLGGDEFLIVLRDVDEAALDDLARRMTEAITAPIDVGGSDASVGASVGVALRQADEDVDSLLRRADAAMYERKSVRRGER